MTELGWAGVLVAVAGGAVRVSTPYLFVSLGETLTEKSGRVNLGLEGTLVLGAMSAYGVAHLSGSPWLGVLVAGVAGAGFGLVHGAVCSLARVNDIAMGIALFLLGTGLAFYLGKPFIEPVAPRLPHLRTARAVHRAPRRGDLPRSLADIGKAVKLLGYRPTFNIDSGLRQTIDWYAENLAAVPHAKKVAHA